MEMWLTIRKLKTNIIEVLLLRKRGIVEDEERKTSINHDLHA